MRKIAFFLNSLAGGGTERVTLSLATGLLRRGLEVTLLLVAKQGELLDSVDPGIKLVDFGKNNAIASLPGLVAYLRVKRPDVLFTALPPVNIVGITARLVARVDTAVIPVEHMPVSIDAQQNPSLHSKLAYFLYPFFYRFVTGIVTISREAQDDFFRTYPSIPRARNRLIYNPVVTDELLQAAAGESSVAWFAQPADVPIILGVGRLVEQKNFELLIRAFAAVRKQMPCRLVILGNGADRGKLETLASQLQVKEDVLMPGFVTNPYACMSRSALFVLSSIRETLSTVLIEALACGLPVVATPCTGVREIISDAQYGTVLAGFELEELVSAMIGALKQSYSRSALKQRALEFSAERSLDAYVALIDDVAIGE